MIHQHLNQYHQNQRRIAVKISVTFTDNSDQYRPAEDQSHFVASIDTIFFSNVSTVLTPLPYDWNRASNTCTGDGRDRNN